MCSSSTSIAVSMAYNSAGEHTIGIFSARTDDEEVDKLSGFFIKDQGFRIVISADAYKSWNEPPETTSGMSPKIIMIISCALLDYIRIQ